MSESFSSSHEAAPAHLRQDTDLPGNANSHATDMGSPASAGESAGGTGALRAGHQNGRSDQFVVGVEHAGGSAPGSEQSNDSANQTTAPVVCDIPASGMTVDQDVRDSASVAGCVVTGDPSQALIEAHESPHTPNLVRDTVGSGVTASRPFTTPQINHGTHCLARLEAVIAFRDRPENEGRSWKFIRKATGVSAVEFCRWNKRIAAAGLDMDSPRSQLIEALAKKAPPGRRPKHSFTETEAAVIAAHNLQSNRTREAGSPQEAFRHAVKRGEVRPALAAELAQREAEGKPLLTASLRRAVQVAETTTRADRTPREAWLSFVQSPGSLQITVDEATGQERMFVPGEAWTMDDATINLILCVAMEDRASACWQKFGVVVGRFQFIVPADHSSYFIPAFSFTARPRSSYRAEDLTATLQIACRQHGKPRVLFLEQGISKSALVHETLRKLGVRCEHVKSPHQKVIETLFNKLWTKLSFLPGQVGRHMGDDEETTKLMMRCRAGQADPRKHFLMLPDVVKALREAIHDHNSQWINHSRYGRWVPQDYWDAKSPAMLRPLDTDSEWMFSPVISDPLTVRGFTVRTTVRLMEGMSQVFHFSAEWMHEFHGAKVKLFFNPFSETPAKVVLAEDFKGYKAETILGDAPMIDRHARMNLRTLGYGAGPDGQPGFPDVGLAAARQNAQALRRSVVGIRPGGKPGIVSNESRDMVVPTAALGNGSAPTSGEGAAQGGPAAGSFARARRGLGTTEEDFEAQAQRLARDEERFRRATQILQPTLEAE